MSVYFIANLAIHDDELYQEYCEKMNELAPKWGLKYLAADDNPLLLEGSWPYNRLVLLEFADQQALDDWYFSTEYQELLALREESADCDVIVVSD